MHEREHLTTACKILSKPTFASAVVVCDIPLFRLADPIVVPATCVDLEVRYFRTLSERPFEKDTHCSCERK